MGDEEVGSGSVVEVVSVDGKTGGFSKSEKILKRTLFSFLAVFLVSFFLNWAGGTYLNLWQVSPWLLGIVGVITISLICLTYFKELDGTLLLASTFTIIYIVSIMLKDYLLTRGTSFSSYVPGFLGFSRSVSNVGPFIFRWSSLFILLLSVALLVSYFLKKKESGEDFKKVMIYSIIVFVLIVSVFFGALFASYSINRMHSNKAVVDFWECAKDCPLEEKVGHGNETYMALESYCQGTCYLEILHINEAAHPGAFWDIGPLICPWYRNAEFYSECVDYVLSEWDKGILVSYEDIKEKGYA